MYASDMDSVDIREEGELQSLSSRMTGSEDQEVLRRGLWKIGSQISAEVRFVSIYLLAADTICAHTGRKF